MSQENDLLPAITQLHNDINNSLQKLTVANNTYGQAFINAALFNRPLKDSDVAAINNAVRKQMTITSPYSSKQLEENKQDTILELLNFQKLCAAYEAYKKLYLRYREHPLYNLVESNFRDFEEIYDTLNLPDNHLDLSNCADNIESLIEKANPNFKTRPLFSLKQAEADIAALDGLANEVKQKNSNNEEVKEKYIKIVARYPDFNSKSPNQTYANDQHDQVHRKAFTQQLNAQNEYKTTLDTAKKNVGQSQKQISSNLFGLIGALVTFIKEKINVYLAENKLKESKQNLAKVENAIAQDLQNPQKAIKQKLFETRRKLIVAFFPGQDYSQFNTPANTPDVSDEDINTSDDEYTTEEEADTHYSINSSK